MSAPLLSTEEIKSIGQSCSEIKSKAYCGYSKFRVGAALLMKDGSIIKGVNIENAAYPVGVCAERTAFGTAITLGYRMGDFRAIAVSTDLNEPCSPCGMCRQFIREFCAQDTPIFMFQANGDHVVKTIGELLPLSFGPEALEKQRELQV